MGACQAKSNDPHANSHTPIGTTIATAEESPILPPPASGLSSNVFSTNGIVMTDVPTGRCKFSGYIVGDTQSLHCHDGYMKRNDRGEVYLSLHFKCRRWVVLLGPQGICASSETEAGILTASLATSVDCILTSQAEVFITIIDNLHIIEDISISFPSPDDGESIVIEGTISWRSASTLDESLSES